MDKKYILGIETSCDETSVALFCNDKFINEVTTSSMSIQSTFGGVVPEIAARYHNDNIHQIFHKLIDQSKINVNQISYICYTKNPGMSVCLHVGEFFAKTLANFTNAKLIPINHLYGHIFSGFIDKNTKIQFPFLSLVISGGHTAIYLVKNYNQIEVLNQTSDDAVGEVLDKVGRAMGIQYPAGPKIDKNFDPKYQSLKLLKNNCPPHAQFSFSGLKTAALNYIHNLTQKNIPIDIVAIGSYVQWFAINDVVKKLKYYVQQTGIRIICVGGGVSANSYLRQCLNEMDIDQITLPNMKYTGDQATMIAYYGWLLISAKIHQ